MVEFLFNNTYQDNIKIMLFETLYDWKYRSPYTGMKLERKFFKIRTCRSSSKSSEDHQITYVDKIQPAKNRWTSKKVH